MSCGFKRGCSRRGNRRSNNRVESCRPCNRGVNGSSYDNSYTDDSYTLADDFDNGIYSNDYRSSSNGDYDDSCGSVSGRDLERCERSLQRAKCEKERVERALERQRCEREKVEKEVARARAQLQRAERELEKERCELQKAERALEREKCATERCNRELERCERSQCDSNRGGRGNSCGSNNNGSDNRGRNSSRSYVVGNSVDICVNNNDTEVKAKVVVQERDTVRVWGQVVDCSNKGVPFALVKLLRETCNGLESVSHTITDCEGFYQFDVCPGRQGREFTILVGKDAESRERVASRGLADNNCKGICRRDRSNGCPGDCGGFVR